MKYLQVILFFMSYAFCYSQSNDTILKIKNIQEVVIPGKYNDRNAKNLKIYWGFDNGEEILSFIKNDSQQDTSFKKILFKFLVESEIPKKAIFRIYSTMDGLPKDLLFSKEVVFTKKNIINTLTFSGGNNLLKKEGVFIGFQFPDEKNTQPGEFSVYVEKDNSPETFYRKNENENWSPFFDEEKDAAIKKFRKVRLYLRIQ